LVLAVRRLASRTALGHKRSSSAAKVNRTQSRQKAGSRPACERSYARRINQIQEMQARGRWSASLQLHRERVSWFRWAERATGMSRSAFLVTALNCGDQARLTTHSPQPKCKGTGGRGISLDKKCYAKSTAHRC